MYIPKFFTFKELIYSNEASKNKIDNTPESFLQVANLYKLSEHLDKIRSKFASPIKVNSGFRSKALNNLLLGRGASSTSYHLFGRAADISPVTGKFTSLIIIVLDYCGFRYISKQNHYENDDYEVIIYPDRNFIHFAFKK